jgi:hypothetical protein
VIENPFTIALLFTSASLALISILFFLLMRSAQREAKKQSQNAEIARTIADSLRTQNARLMQSLALAAKRISEFDPNVE